MRDAARQPLPRRATSCQTRRIATINATTTAAAHITAAHLLAAKPGRLVTIGPSARIGEAVSLLVVHRIGALVVTFDLDHAVDAYRLLELGELSGRAVVVPNGSLVSAVPNQPTREGVTAAPAP